MPEDASNAWNKLYTVIWQLITIRLNVLSAGTNFKKYLKKFLKKYLKTYLKKYLKKYLNFKWFVFVFEKIESIYICI